MATKRARPAVHPGEEWLLSCTTTPTGVRKAWAVEELAPIPTGVHWCVAEAPLMASVHAMKRIGSARLGPVLADVHVDRAWWLLPPGLDWELDDVRQVIVRSAGWVLKCPPVTYALDGRMWLERPDGSGRLTDPVLLGAALGPGGGARSPSEGAR